MSEIEGWKVGFVDFAETEGIGDVAFVAFNFDKVFAIAPTVVEGKEKGVFVVVGFERPFAALGVTFFTLFRFVSVSAESLTTVLLSSKFV